MGYISTFGIGSWVYQIESASGYQMLPYVVAISVIS